MATEPCRHSHDEIFVDVNCYTRTPYLYCLCGWRAELDESPEPSVTRVLALAAGHREEAPQTTPACGEILLDVNQYTRGIYLACPCGWRAELDESPEPSVTRVLALAAGHRADPTSPAAPATLPGGNQTG